MDARIYKPAPASKGYYFHGNVYHEALLTYGQYLEKKHGEKAITGDPDDSTNYYTLDWYKNGSISFAEKEWPDFIIRLRNIIKLHCGMSLQKKEGDEQYIYHIGSVLGLDGTFLIRSRIFIQHSAIFEMDTDKFLSDITRIGRWEKH